MGKKFQIIYSIGKNLTNIFGTAAKTHCGRPRLLFCYWSRNASPELLLRQRTYAGPTALPGRLDTELEQTEPKAPRSHTASDIVLHLWHPQILLHQTFYSDTLAMEAYWHQCMETLSSRTPHS